jgi:hypothetical protein
MERLSEKNKPCNFCREVREDGLCNNQNRCPAYVGWFIAAWDYWSDKSWEKVRT